MAAQSAGQARSFSAIPAAASQRGWHDRCGACLAYPEPEMGISDFGLTFVLIGAATLLLPHLDRRDNRARMALFGICILLVWRYVAWRFSVSIPPLAPS